DQELQINEIAFDIREAAPASPSANGAPAKAPSLPAEPVPATDAPARLSDSDLSNAELALRFQLFQKSWDIGEALSISQSGSKVILSGVVSSEDRTRKMRETFSANPSISLAIQSPEEAAALRPAVAIPAVPASIQTRSAPVLLPLLEQGIPDFESRRVL